MASISTVFIDNFSSRHIHDDESLEARRPSVAEYDDALWVIWYESLPGDITSRKIGVRKYNKTEWTTDSLERINGNTASSMFNTPDLAAFKGELFGVWTEMHTAFGSTSDVVKVKKYDGESWEWAHPPMTGWGQPSSGTLSVNWSNNRNSNNTNLVVAGGELYCVWREDTTSPLYNDNVVRVKKYDSENNDWDLVGTLGMHVQTDITATEHNAKLYIAFRVGEEINISAYDDTAKTWTSISTTALNTRGIQRNPCLASYQGALYCMWSSFNSGETRIVYLAKYDSSWSMLGALNYNEEEDSYLWSSGDLYVFEDLLICAWAEDWAWGSNKRPGIRVKSYDGSVFRWVDRNNRGLKGQQFTQDVSPRLASFDSKLFGVWAQNWQVGIRAVEFLVPYYTTGTVKSASTYEVLLAVELQTGYKNPNDNWVSSVNTTEETGNFNVLTFSRGGDVYLSAKAECHIPNMNNVECGSELKWYDTIDYGDLLVAPVSLDIYTSLDLFNMRYCPSGNFTLMNNIDLSSFVIPEDTWWEYDMFASGTFPPVEELNTGSFDGQNFVISNFNILGKPGAYCSQIGLFGTISQSIIENLNLVNVCISGSFSYACGTIVGEGIDNVKITRCSVEGAIEIEDGTWDWGTGGLVGALYNANSRAELEYPACVISQCFTSVDINGTYEAAGGILGDGNCEVKNCYARGAITSHESYGNFLGGLVGYHYPWINYDTTIVNCYSTGVVSNHENVSNSGGLIGFYDNNSLGVINSYYDSELSGQSDTGKGKPRSTEDMTYPYNENNTYLNWDFNNIWGIDFSKNDGYPILMSFTSFKYLMGSIQGESDLITSFSRVRLLIVNMEIESDIKTLLSVYLGLKGNIEINSDIIAEIIKFKPLSGTVEVNSQWLIKQLIQHIWAKHNGVYKPVTAYVKVNGEYKIIEKVYRKIEGVYRK